MHKFVLRIGVMFLTFTLSLAGNFLLNRLATVIEEWFEAEPLLEEPCAFALTARPAPMPPVPNCGLLFVQVGNDRSVTLNGRQMGTLYNTSRLVATLNEVFTGRIEARAYRPGFELNADDPAEERIERTVLIKAPRWVSYGEVSDLIGEIRATGAKPIGLISEEPATIERQR